MTTLNTKVGYLAIALMACALGQGGVASAQGSGEAMERLAQAQKVQCEFTLMATGTWVKGEAQAEIKPTKLSIGFDSIDADSGTARVIGAFGPSDIIVRLSGGTLHFVQSFREGPLYATTIFPFESRNGKLLAAHTRHEFTVTSVPGFTSRPEQYYGECEAFR